MKKLGMFIGLALLVFVCSCSQAGNNTADGPAVPAVPKNISYTTNFPAADMFLYSIKGIKDGDSIQFTLITDSGVNRNFLFFDPPNGDIIRYSVTQGILAGTQTNLFKIKISDIKLVNHLTLSLYTVDEGNNGTCNFASLTYSDVSSLF